MGAIYRRELGSFFNSAIGPVLIGSALCLCILACGLAVLAVLSELCPYRYE